ncbi:hypothetical protein B0H13DRAFT_2678047 [Mycena leptocephala]|nr:hypothetical protein B0H13DRAFT_2678047 [Mycena leptocephala]
MHQALRPSNLSSLPLPLRRIASEAANGSLPSLRRLSVLIPGLPRNHADLLLPVFYIHLDPRGIPKPENLDIDANVDDTVSVSVTKAAEAMTSLHLLKFDTQEVFLELWPRYWLWLEFFLRYGQYIPWCHPPSEAYIYKNLIVFVQRFQPTVTGHVSQTTELISRTAGFRVMIVRAWVSFLHAEANETAYYTHCACILKHMETWDGWNIADPTNLQILINGAGGSIDHLSLLIIGHIKRVFKLERPDGMKNALVIYLIHGVLKLVAEAEREKGSSLLLCPLTQALVTHGYVQIITRLLCTLVVFPPATKPTPIVAVSCCFLILETVFASAVGPRLLPGALKNGLLTAIVLCGQSEMAATMHGHLKVFLEGLLPDFMIYHDVVLRMDLALDGVKNIDRTDKFQKCRIFKGWQAFKALACERVGVLAFLRSPDNPSYKACDNVECGHISEKTDLRRCVECQSQYYCSRECQKRDWHHGRHRETCTCSPSLWFNSHSPFTVRDRAFIRAVMDHDYGAISNAEIRVREATILRAHSNRPSVTLFDYTAGRVRINIHSLEQVAELLGPMAGAQWTDEVTRALRSGGRMALHLLCVQREGRRRYWVVPLRSSTSLIHDEQRRLDDNGVRGMEIH